jgi:excisionase family DNA binding protein
MKSEATKTNVTENAGAALQKGPPAFLTYKEFACESRLSVSTVRKHVRQGNVRATRIGRSVRIPRSELERLTQQSERSGKREE